MSRGRKRGMWISPAAAGKPLAPVVADGPGFRDNRPEFTPMKRKPDPEPYHRFGEVDHLCASVCRGAGEFGVLRAARASTDRNLRIRAVSTEARGNSDKYVVTGLAVPYGKLSCDLGGFREVVQRGAFGDSIKSDIRVLFNGNTSLVLGRTEAKTAVLYEDTAGLHFECDPPDGVSYADDLIVSMERQDVTGAAAHFQIQESHWDRMAGEKVRVITKGRLIAVSVVSWADFDIAEASAARLQPTSALKAGMAYLPLLAETGKGKIN